MKQIFDKKILNQSPPLNITKSNNLDISKHKNFETLKINSRLDKLIDSPISGNDLKNK
jgi:hypothetical protein